MKPNILILGASDNRDRYSYKAFKMLRSQGYNIFLVNPQKDIIEGCSVFKNISDVKNKIDTVTMYVSSNISNSMTRELVKLAPRRVIFNPGSENSDLENELKRSGIEVEHACTLVLLSIGQF